MWALKTTACCVSTASGKFLSGFGNLVGTIAGWTRGIGVTRRQYLRYRFGLEMLKKQEHLAMCICRKPSNPMARRPAFFFG